MMKRVIDVSTGKVKVGRKAAILKTMAIGSCIVVGAYEGVKCIGGMAHIMLPGKAPANKKTFEKTRYAADAIDVLLSRMARLGMRGHNRNIEIVVVGGGNVLKRDDDSICTDNIKSTLDLLRKNDLKVRTKVVGGFVRRSLTLDVENGIFSYTEGNGGKIRL